MTDAYREASKYNTAARREVKRHREAIARELQNHEERMQALRAELSPAAARIVVAAESGPDLEQAADRVAAISGYEPAVPDWATKAPEQLAAGAMLEVTDKPKARRA